MHKAYSNIHAGNRSSEWKDMKIEVLWNKENKNIICCIIDVNKVHEILAGHIQ